MTPPPIRSASTSSVEDESATLPQETEAWKRAYRDPQLIASRSKKHRTKLQRLGVLDWPRQSRLMDLCCGTGEVLRILHREGFSDLHGVDITIDPELKNENWLDAKAADGRALPYPDAHFDAVICMHSLHHLGGVAGIRAALKEARRILKPGGRLGLIDHFDSPQLRLVFNVCRQSLVPWPTSAMRSFRSQLDEEWPYLTEYLDNWKNVRAAIDELGFKQTATDRKGLFFFYWVGEKK